MDKLKDGEANGTTQGTAGVGEANSNSRELSVAGEEDSNSRELSVAGIEAAAENSDGTGDAGDSSGNIRWETAMIYATELTFRAKEGRFSFTPHYTALRLHKDIDIVMSKCGEDLLIEEDGVKGRGTGEGVYDADEVIDTVPWGDVGNPDVSCTISERERQAEQGSTGSSVFKGDLIHGLNVQIPSEDIPDIMALIFSEMTEHNIFELKSQGEHVNLIVFLYTLGYVAAYIRGRKWAVPVELKDVTLILIKNSYPRALVKELSEKSGGHYRVKCLTRGVYRISGFFSPVMLLVPREIVKGFELLSILTRNAREEDVREVIRIREESSDQDTKEKINVILRTSAEGNTELFRKLREENKMSEAFKIIFPEVWEQNKKYEEDIEQKNNEIEQKNNEIEQKNNEIEQKNSEIEQKNSEIENTNRLLKLASQGLPKEIRRELLKELISSGKNGEFISYITGFTRETIDFAADELKTDVKWSDDDSAKMIA